jgi:hypothetical protein
MHQKDEHSLGIQVLVRSYDKMLIIHPLEIPLGSNFNLQNCPSIQDCHYEVGICDLQ